MPDAMMAAEVYWAGRAPEALPPCAVHLHVLRNDIPKWDTVSVCFVISIFYYNDAWRKRVKNKFFTQQVCVCALLDSKLDMRKNSAEMR